MNGRWRIGMGQTWGALACGLVVGAVALGAGFVERVGASRQGRRAGGVLTGKAALGDWATDAPGVRRRLTPADMPRPFATKSVQNGPRYRAWPAKVLPKVPPGFRVAEFAAGFENPREIVTAPNGDLFLAESKANRIRILRDADGDGQPELNEIYAAGLNLPFGLAFYPPAGEPRYLYVGNTDSVARFPYRSGDTRAGGRQEMVVPGIPGYGEVRGGGHWTRDVAFSRDGRRMFVAVGSLSNVTDDAREEGRACIREYRPDGSGFRMYATGIRNPVGLAVHPTTGDLWTSVNERDELGEQLVPDYVTRVQEGGFYGWPWFYIGGNADPRHAGKRPELREKAIVPDVLIQSHSASLDLCFYTGQQFPAEYRGHLFVAEHGSWNKARRTGHKVIRIPVVNGRATGEYEDFMTGMVRNTKTAYGRPVGVTVAKDGALLVTDDGASNCIWRVTYGGR